jgi:hypothetical protein
MKSACVSAIDRGVVTGVQECSDEQLSTAWIAGVRQVDLGEQALPLPSLESVAVRRRRQPAFKSLDAMDDTVLSVEDGAEIWGAASSWHSPRLG